MPHDEQAAAVCTYQMPWLFRLWLFVGLGVLAGMSAWSAAAELRAGSSYPVVGTCMVVIGVLDAYVVLCRVADRLEVNAAEIVWRAPLRSRRVPLDQVRFVRPGLLMGTCGIDTAGSRGRGFLVWVRPSLVEFVGELVRVAPQVEVSPQGLGRTTIGRALEGPSVRSGASAN
ncbi:hypothetical protein ACPA54_36370 [Uniformispora flossi]|uniref:hypothetical protein n=1 Tax=Uniformispora flossi TaxID=3390723 RepID=UPI003C2DDA7F